MKLNFYIIDDETLFYSTICKVILKITQNIDGQLCIFTLDLSFLKEIDLKLWTFSQNEFIPHATIFDEYSVNKLNKIILTNNFQDLKGYENVLIFNEILSLKNNNIFVFLRDKFNKNFNKVLTEYKDYIVSFFEFKNEKWLQCNNLI